MDLSGKIAIITGGGGSLAQEIGKQLLQEGVKVFLCDLSEKNAEKNADLLKKTYNPKDIGFGACDVTSDKSFRGAFEQCKQFFGHPATILVNNAGVFDERNWEATMDVNLKGTIRGTTLALEHMGKDKGHNGGLILNIASSSGFIAAFPFPYYSASKSGIIHYTRCIGNPFYVQRTGVIVQAICPGFLAHRMNIDGTETDRLYDPDTLPQVVQIRNSSIPVDSTIVVGEMIKCFKDPKPGSIKLCTNKNPSRFMEPQLDLVG